MRTTERIILSQLENNLHGARQRSEPWQVLAGLIAGAAAVLTAVEAARS